MRTWLVLHSKEFLFQYINVVSKAANMLMMGASCLYGQYRAKKVRFPKGKKESARRIDTEPIFGEEDGGPILSTDPRVAAKERTMKRTVGDQQILKSDDISLIPDVGAAEEEVCQLCPLHLDLPISLPSYLLPSFGVPTLWK